MTKKWKTYFKGGTKLKHDSEKKRPRLEMNSWCSRWQLPAREHHTAVPSAAHLQRKDTQQRSGNAVTASHNMLVLTEVSEHTHREPPPGPTAGHCWGATCCVKPSSEIIHCDPTLDNTSTQRTRTHRKCRSKLRGNKSHKNFHST